MKVIGLTGGIATGKSTVANLFRDNGIPVFDADSIVHQLMAKGGEAVIPVGAAFPSSAADGYIDRKKLGSLVFFDKEKLKLLESILHPLVRQEEIEFIKDCKERNEILVVLEIPLLFETRAERLCDLTIVTDCPPAIQAERALARPNMTKEKLDRILAEQISREERTNKADRVISTQQPIEDVRKEVQQIIREYQL